MRREKLLRCLRWLLNEDAGWQCRSPNNVKWLMLSITALLFVFSTVDLGISMRMIYAAVLGDPRLSVKLNIATAAIEHITIMVTDAVLIHRCWMVYLKSWRIISLPLLLWFADLACAFLFIYWDILSTLKPNDTARAYRLTLVCATFYVCNCATNLYATSAIVYRILRIARGSKNVSGGLHVVSRILAESGIMYTSMSLILLLTLYIPGCGMLPPFIADVINFSMAGITFNLILIRVGQYRAKEGISVSDTKDDHEPHQPTVLLCDPPAAGTACWPPSTGTR